MMEVRVGSQEEQQPLCDEQKGERDMYSALDFVLCLGDFNGHVGRHIDVIDGVHRRYGVA